MTENAPSDGGAPVMNGTGSSARTSVTVMSVLQRERVTKVSRAGIALQAVPRGSRTGNQSIGLKRD